MRGGWLNTNRINLGLIAAGVVGWLASGLVACQSAQRALDPEPAPPKRVTFAKEPEIRVRVASGVTSREVDQPGNVVLRASGGGHPDVKPQLVPTPLKITSSSAGITVVWGKSKRVFPAGVDLDVTASESAGASSEWLRVGGVRYPGFMTIRPQWNGDATRLDAIATMPLETYLPGVLTHELPRDWPRQAYEMQGVAARTYALHERGRARAEGRQWDVESNINDQMFGGGTDLVTPNEAVRATRGQILVTDGKPLRAYYSSTCGGRPASAAKVWPVKSGYEFNLAPPVQGKPREFFCQPSKWYRWEVTRRDDDVNKRLRAWGKANNDHPVARITRVREITVLERNDAQRPNAFQLLDSDGNRYRLSAEELRFAFNQPVSGLPPITPENRVNSGDFEADIWASSVRVRGRGFGHGVGMCQYCAKGMAENGWDWGTMVRKFYPGAEVQKAYP